MNLILFERSLLEPYYKALRSKSEYAVLVERIFEN